MTADVGSLQRMANSFTTEISPMFGLIIVGGGGGERLPSRPAGSMALAWADENSPAMVALYPPSDRMGPDIVTVEEIEGDFLGHREAGADLAFTGRLNFIGQDPYIGVDTPTGATVRLPFEIRPGGIYELWVEVAGRQEAIMRYEQWKPDDEPLPAVEHWWVTLRFLEDLEDWWI